MAQLRVLPPAAKFLKKLKDKKLKELYKQAIDAILEDPTIGEEKTGDLKGVRGYDIYHNRINYELAYTIEYVQVEGKDEPEVVVVIMAGTNDVAENNGKITLENILGNLKSMVELAKAHNIRPILCSVPPAAGFVWRKDLSPAKDIIKLNKMIKEYADSINIPYIDYHSLLTDENGGLPKKYAKDGVHPVLAGYKLMEGLLLEEFKKIDK